MVLHIGFGNYVVKSRILALIKNQGDAMRREINGLRDDGKYINATFGRKARGLIHLDNGQVVGTNMSVETLRKRMEVGDAGAKEIVDRVGDEEA